jgi:hypothetical protein
MITLTKESIAALHQEVAFQQCFKFGFRAVLFINKISEENLSDLVNPETGAPICDWSGKALEGKGATFYNPKDHSLQAIPVTGETCLIFGLGGDRAVATENQKLIIDAINTALPNGIHTAADITIAATVGGEITQDVYNSDAGWFKANTRSIEAQDNFHFVEGRGNEVHTLYIPGEVSIDSGITATPQTFDNGTYLIATKQSDGSMEFHGCDPEVFNATFRQKVSGKLVGIDEAFTAKATCALVEDSAPCAAAAAELPDDVAPLGDSDSSGCE